MCSFTSTLWWAWSWGSLVSSWHSWRFGLLLEYPSDEIQGGVRFEILFGPSRWLANTQGRRCSDLFPVRGSVGLWDRTGAFRVALRGKVWVGETVLLSLHLSSCKPPSHLPAFSLVLSSCTGWSGDSVAFTWWFLLVPLASSHGSRLSPGRTVLLSLGHLLIYLEFIRHPQVELSGACPLTGLNISEH